MPLYWDLSELSPPHARFVDPNIAVVAAHAHEASHDRRTRTIYTQTTLASSDVAAVDGRWRHLQIGLPRGADRIQNLKPRILVPA